MILHNKTIADMFLDQLNNNQGLFGVRYLILYNNSVYTILCIYLPICYIHTIIKYIMYFSINNVFIILIYTD